jgi:hypothetical protein
MDLTHPTYISKPKNSIYTKKVQWRNSIIFAFLCLQETADLT